MDEVDSTTFVEEEDEWSSNEEESSGYRGEREDEKSENANNDSHSEVDVTMSPLKRQRTVPNAGEGDCRIKPLISGFDCLSKEDLLRLYLDQRDHVEYLTKERNALKSKLKMDEDSRRIQILKKPLTQSHTFASHATDGLEDDDASGYFL